MCVCTICVRHVSVCPVCGCKCILSACQLDVFISEIRPHERHKSVFRCCVFGSKNAGKTSFIRGLIGKDQVCGGNMQAYSLLNSCPYTHISQTTVTNTGIEEAISIRLLEAASNKGYLVVGVQYCCVPQMLCNVLPWLPCNVLP